MGETEAEKHRACDISGSQRVFFCLWFSERAALTVNPPDWVKRHRMHLRPPSHPQPIHVCLWIRKNKNAYWSFFLVASVSHRRDSTSVIVWFFISASAASKPSLAFDKWLIGGWSGSKRPLLTFLRHRHCVLFTSFVRCEMCAAVTKRLRASCPESHNSSLWKSFGGDQYPSDR